MSLKKTIKYFREEKNIPSLAMFPDHSKSYYSKLENGKSALRVDELSAILSRLELSYSEFYAYFDDGFDGRFISLFRGSAENPSDDTKKKTLLEYYYKDEHAFSNNAEELAEYYSIKSHFNGAWTEIKKISDKEKNHLLKFLLSKNIYTYYDYVILCNTIIYFDRRNTLDLVNKMLPISFPHKRDFSTKKMAYTAYINIITARIYNGDLDEAKAYMTMAEAEDIAFNNYYFKLSIQYLKNLILYLETEEITYLNKIYNYITLVEDMGDSDVANLLKQEVSSVISRSKKLKNPDVFPHSLIKDQ